MCFYWVKQHLQGFDSTWYGIGRRVYVWSWDGTWKAMAGYYHKIPAGTDKSSYSNFPSHSMRNSLHNSYSFEPLEFPASFNTYGIWQTTASKSGQAETEIGGRGSADYPKRKVHRLPTFPNLLSTNVSNQFSVGEGKMLKVVIPEFSLQR